MANDNRPTRRRLVAAGVREIARQTGYSPTYVCITKNDPTRKARPLRNKMRELGLKFKKAI